MVNIISYLSLVLQKKGIYFISIFGSSEEGYLYHIYLWFFRRRVFISYLSLVLQKKGIYFISISGSSEEGYLFHINLWYF
jgi:penicillin-binding protein-related factor A (putative recombinase)